MIKHKAHRIRKRNRCRAQFPDLCHLAMLGLTISICRSCWVVLGSVSTPCLAHSRNTFIANVLKNYHPHPFSRDQRGEGGFLWYPGEVVKWKKQPSQWLLPSFGSGDTWGRHDGKIHRWTLESNTKSSAPAPMFFCLFFYDWSHFSTILATQPSCGTEGPPKSMGSDANTHSGRPCSPLFQWWERDQWGCPRNKASSFQ